MTYGNADLSHDEKFENHFKTYVFTTYNNGPLVLLLPFCI